MCANCVSRLDALALQPGAVLVAAASGGARLRHWWAGGSSADRRHAAYERTATFLRSLDLDTEAILGPAPTAASQTRP